MSDFEVLLNPPTLSAMLQTFWANAPATLSITSIDTVSMANQIIRTFLAGSGNLWISLTEMGVNFSDIRRASGPWLRIIAKGFFDVEYTKASPTIGIITLTRVGTMTDNQQVTLRNPVTGITYTGTWNGSGALATNNVTFMASTNGPNGNCSISDLTSASAGLYTLSTSNPTGRAWITSEGTDDEADGHLRQRCLDVIALRSEGGASSIASQIRTATNSNVWRVHCPRGSAIVYVAGQTGPANASYESICTLTASKYSRSSLTPFIVGCAVPIATQTISIGGTLSFPPGTSTTITTAVVQGVKTWLDSLPIRTGEVQENINLAMVMRKIFELDPTDQVIPEVFASTMGYTLQRPLDLLPSTVGAIFQADVSSLKVAFQ